ncbi:MAG: Gfo/Idh/MocA family oxidoreductase [Verrucomicrobiaceae bacterium]|nr:MAG: Gfo/Idh/MocA family oxidoreductase [Verrucomicrobiaceae bacterium]
MQRRHFLRTSAAAVAAPFILSGRPAYADEFGEMKKRVGLIGTGWYGKADLLRLVQVAPVEVVSLCDVDSVMLKEAGDLTASRQLSKKVPRLYRDYREMLKEKDLDMVLIATPDHWHALAMIEAAKAGADIYVQKPTGVDVTESAAMLAAARKYGRVVQVGTQRRSTPHLIEALETIIKPGKLGKVAHVDLCCYYHMRSGSTAPDTTPPAHLDYDMWSGPAPKRPYNPIVHPRSWRAFMEYGNGIVGDMCVHMLDMVRWMLDLGWPSAVSSSGGIFQDKASRANISDTQTAVFTYPELDVVWTHRSWGSSPDPQYPWAAIIYGEKGTLKLSVNSYDFIPSKGQPVHRDCVMELEQYPEDKTEKDLEKHVAPAIRGHMRDLLRNIASRGKPVADIEQGHISSASCILANLAMRTGRTLHYDPAAAPGGVVKDDPEATALLTRPYTGPWVHPDPALV